MEFEDILKHNKKILKERRDKCKHEELDDIRVIYKRCLCCGKLVPVADEEYLKKHGLAGRGLDFKTS
jgi:inorganic triphosphatase YgiF